VLAIGAPPVFASVLISVDKNTQRMSVSVDGAPRYDFVVSTGRPGYGTPSGIYHPQHMERTWFSKEYYNSPMPHSIFSTAVSQYTVAMRSADSEALPHMAASGYIRRMPLLFIHW
jgi:hypothetical protein